VQDSRLGLSMALPIALPLSEDEMRVNDNRNSSAENWRVIESCSRPSPT
jgi:hypothetical protein